MPLDPGDVRYLFTYDRWATEKVLDQLAGVDAELWGREGVVGDRGLGSILVHMLGAHQRWRLAFEGSEESPSPEDEPLVSPEELVARWRAEAALLLTQAGRSPGELDLIFFAEDVAAGNLPDPLAPGSDAPAVAEQA